MARMVWLVLAVALWMVAGADAARAEERLALVIGNKSYVGDGWWPVVPAENDARDMAAALEGLGFTVTRRTNLKREELFSVVQAFGRQVRAMKDGVALVYFSGHGVGLPSSGNYLIPVDVGVRSAEEIERNALSLGFILAQLGEAPNRLNLIILDACRNNPFTAGAGAHYAKGVEGFRPGQPPEGTIVHYAARPGSTARWLEGSTNSLYTGHLKQEITVAGRSLQDALTATEGAVARDATGHGFSQRPWFEGPLSLASQVWLKRGESPPPPPPPPPPREYVQDCPDCPELVKIPTGSFEMGSGEEERKWYVAQGAKEEWAAWEAPRHRVTIGREFLLGRTEVTRGQFAAFVKDSGHATPGGCYRFEGSEWKLDEKRSWRDPGFSQTDQDPVVCVSWEDAQAYVRWLSGKTSKSYRLPSEAEWEYAARAGTTTWRYWGDDKSNTALCGYANGADKAFTAQYVNYSGSDCQDGHVHTAPVASLKANDFKLHDMLGNALEWVDDCFHDSYNGAPSNGTAWTTGECKTRVLRGGSWLYVPWYLRSAIRYGNSPGLRFDNSGFRVARTF